MASLSSTTPKHAKLVVHYQTCEKDIHDTRAPISKQHGSNFAL